MVSAPAPPLTWGRLLTAWTPNPAALVAVAALGVAYGLGVRRLRRGAVAWPAGRSWCFLVGLGSILLVTVSVVGVYAGTLFWDRAVQNITLLMIAPMFLALGAPLTLLREVLPEPATRAAGRVLHSRAARALTFPVVVTAALIAPLFVLYLTPLYEAGLRSAALGAAVGVGLVAAGFLYFWTRLRIDPTPRADPYLLTMSISVAEVIFDGVLGLVLWLGPLVAPHYYQALHRGWGPDPRLDQIIGAGVLWIGGDLAGLPFLAAVVNRMMREDQRHAAAVDAELDTLDASAGASPTTPAPTRPRLWWEDHPELAQRFRHPGAGI
ncbi:MAG: cytochrome c oxidase assembly protein [Pseudonocardiales bacterium]|nr:cytochrome c oxidase assembly protein [Pseudonocardiales bacterium]MBV9029805.1 cytochrome c oxidase assembly protein [Pseudonocardiales bacterium]